MIKYGIPGLKKLQDAIRLTPGQLAARDGMAIDSSLELLKGSLAGAISSGPGHFGYHARDRLFTRVAAVRRVEGVLYTTAPQLRWGEEGTRPHVINRWLDTGRGYSIRLTLHHPGEKATHLFRATLAATRPAIRSIFAGSTQRVLGDFARRAQ